MTAFDPEMFARRFGRIGHNGRIGTRYHAHGADWVELALDHDPGLVMDAESGVLASGAIFALMDMATSMAVWARQGLLRAHATLDLRVDYLRAAIPGRTIFGRGTCYRVTRHIAFVRGQAHDGDAADPLAHVAGTFMFLDAGRPA